MSPQLEAAWIVHVAMRERGLRYAILGGIAVQFWGQPRFTKDLDITVMTEFGAEQLLIDELLGLFAPRYPDAANFAIQNRVLLLRVGDLCDLDVSLGLPGFESEVMDRAVEMDIGQGRLVRVLSAEDLIIYKALAGRSRDQDDIKGILSRQGHALDLSLVERHLMSLCELLESDEPLQLLRRLVKATGLS